MSDTIDPNNTNQPIDSVASSTQQSDDASTVPASPQPVTSGSGGPESMRRAEVQPQTEALVNKEEPPFIKEILGHAEQAQHAARDLKKQGNIDGAIKAEEEVLEEFASLDPSVVNPEPDMPVSPSTPIVADVVSDQSDAPAPPPQPAVQIPVNSQDVESNGDEYSIDDIPGVQHNFSSFTISESASDTASKDGKIVPTTISQPQVTGQMLDNTAPPIKATVTSIPTENVPERKVSSSTPGDIQVSEQPEGSISVDAQNPAVPDVTEAVDSADGDTGKAYALAILEGVVQKLIADSNASDNLDQLTVKDSEEALYRIIEQDILQAIHYKLVQGEWNRDVDLDSLATKLGMFAAIDVLRGLKSQALDDSSQHKIQLAIDYLMDEYDKLEIQDAQERVTQPA